MAVGMLMAAPGFTQETYEQINDKVFGRRDWNAADVQGLIMHSAGPTEGGFYVYDIWESREDFERFMNEKLGPAFQEVLGGPPPAEAQPQYYEITNLVR
jgi:hypothetical protein